MASFANPFAAGGYGADAASLSGASDVSLSYLVGVPNPQTLDDPKLVIAFKNILKRDPTTREKGVAELIEYLEASDSSAISDSLHFAWVQAYAKLSIDVSASVRELSHRTLGLLFAKLGKRSTKHLKEAIGPWYVGKRDPDGRASSAANESWTSIFPLERQGKVMQKMGGSVADFVMDVVINQTAGTLSDERFVSPEDAALKYARVLKASLDVLNFDLLSPEHSTEDWYTNVSDQLKEKSLWKLASSDSPQIAQAVLALATSHSDRLSGIKDIVWKEFAKALVTGNPAIFVELIRALTVLSKPMPELWSASHIKALAQNIAAKGTKPKTYWPLLYNLVMNMPASVSIETEQTQKLVLPALAKSVPSIIGDTSISAWGCYLALASKSKSAGEVTKALGVVNESLASDRPRSALFLKALADRFKDLSSFSTTQTTLEKYLETDSWAPKTLERYAVVLVMSGAFESLQDDLFNGRLNSKLTLHQFATISREAPALSVNAEYLISLSTDSEQDINDLVQIAAHVEHTATSQAIVDHVARTPTGVSSILESSRTLTLKGLRGSLAKDIDTSDNSMVAKAILAHGGFVSDAKAEEYTRLLVERAAAQDESALHTLGHAASVDQPFVTRIIKESGSVGALTSLQSDETTPTVAALVAGLQSLDTTESFLANLHSELGASGAAIGSLVQRALRLLENGNESDYGKLLLVKTQWIQENSLLVDCESSILYDIPWPVSGSVNAVAWECTLQTAIYLLNLYLDVEDSAIAKTHATAAATSELHAKLAVVASAARANIYTNRFPKLDELQRNFVAEVDETMLVFAEQENETLADSLWELVDSADAGIQFHSAQLLSRLIQTGAAPVSSELAQQARRSFDPPSIKGALLAHNSIGRGLPWYDMQQSRLLGRVAGGLKPAEYAMLDPKFDEDRLKAVLLESAAQIEGDSLVQTLLVVLRMPDLPDLTSDQVYKFMAQGVTARTLTLRQLDPSLMPEVVGEAFLDYSDDIESDSDQEMMDQFLAHATHSFHKSLELDLDLDALKAAFLNRSKTWVALCYLAPHAENEFRLRLVSSELADAELPETVQSGLLRASGDLKESAWVLYLTLVATYAEESLKTSRKLPLATSVFSHYSGTHDAVLSHVQSWIRNASPVGFDSVKAEVFDPTSEQAVNLHLLYLLSLHMGSVVRSWFRSITDRATSAKISSLLSKVITPAIMRTVAKNVRESRNDGTLEGTSVSEATRELRAIMDINEDEVMIVISVPETFPVKSSRIEIKGLAGVPEAKKRAWLLEAETSMQSGAFVKAIRSLILRFQNFMDGFEPCAICYSVVLENKTLPTRECSTCHNRYHSDCLSKWISTGGSRTCPLCRAPI